MSIKRISNDDGVQIVKAEVMKGLSSCLAKLSHVRQQIEAVRRRISHYEEYLERGTYLQEVPGSTLTSTDREYEARGILANCKAELLRLLETPEDLTRLHARLQAFLDDEQYWKSSEIEPALLPQSALDYKGFWLYQNNLYSVALDQAYTTEQRKLLIMEECDKERRKFERLKARFNSETAREIEYSRPNIPEHVRVGVWRRDQGKCVRCGGRKNLEYDHIIPISKGGSSTIRNIELLCEECNRQKRDEIR